MHGTSPTKQNSLLLASPIDHMVRSGVNGDIIMGLRPRTQSVVVSTGHLKKPSKSGAGCLVRLELDIKSGLEDARLEVIQTAPDSGS